MPYEEADVALIVVDRVKSEGFDFDEEVIRTRGGCGTGSEFEAFARLAADCGAVG